MTSELLESWSPFRCRDGFDMRAWWVRPAASGPLPGVLFVYEPFGINPEMQRVASELASEGYVVMIPDLMQRGSFIGCIRRLMDDLKAGKGRGIDDLLDARQALMSRPDVLTDRVAVMGLCMGGGFALILAKTGLFRVSDRRSGVCHPLREEPAEGIGRPLTAERARRGSAAPARSSSEECDG